MFLLRDNQETFEPYQPGSFTDFVVLGAEVQEEPLFAFLEGQAHAERLRDQADQRLYRGAYHEAIELWHAALQTFSYLDGIYERLDFAYMSLGQWDLAVEAFEAAFMQNTLVNFRPLQNPGAQALPAVLEVTRERGLASCRHGIENELDLVSPGVGVGDLDGDGYPDVICLGGPHNATRVFRGGPAKFTEVGGTGLEEVLVSQGVYLLDLTHNGLLDVIVTAIGSTRLYLNQGAMRFTPSSIPVDEMWGSALAAGDFTGNGNVDLVVGGWIGREIWRGLEHKRPSFDAYGAEPPEQRQARRLPNPNAPLHLLNVSVRYGVPLRLLEGDGAGNFLDVTEKSGVDVSATTLNLELIDVNGDGHLDLIVINDAVPSRLFLGDGKGRFRDVTYASRFADLRAGMGLAVADFFGHGEWDFVKTHFQGEMNGVFMHDGLHDGVPSYRDVALGSGLGAPSLPYVGWAAFAWDFDADGEEDLLILNGHLRETPQPIQLFHNRKGHFSDLTGALPVPVNEPFRARGGALFDMTGNGYDDLLIVQNDGAARLFEMHPRHENNWIRVRVRVPDVDALGGVVELVDTHGRLQRRPVRTGSAFLSTQPRDYFFGLGKAAPRRLTWRGRATSFSCEVPLANRIVTIRQGACEQSKPLPAPPVLPREAW